MASKLSTAACSRLEECDSEKLVALPVRRYRQKSANGSIQVFCRVPQHQHEKVVSDEGGVSIAMMSADTCS